MWERGFHARCALLMLGTDTLVRVAECVFRPLHGDDLPLGISTRPSPSASFLRPTAGSPAATRASPRPQNVHFLWTKSHVPTLDTAGMYQKAPSFRVYSARVADRAPWNHPVAVRAAVLPL